MNPFYDLYEFYEQNTNLLGKKFQKKFKSETSNYFLNPLGFTTITPDYVIEISDDSKILGVYREDTECLAPISVTSNYRTRDVNPHILFDKIEYFKLEIKKNAYLEQLKNMKTILNGVSKEFDIVSNYILKNTVYKDLENAIPKLVESELKKNSKEGALEKAIDREYKNLDKKTIKFRLASNPNYFDDIKFIDIWKDTFTFIINNSTDYIDGFDYITGNTESIARVVSNISGKGKLSIVSKYTVKEQFENIRPSTVGFIPFEKAMNALKFLMKHQSVNIYAGNSRTMILIDKSKNKNILTDNSNIFSELLIDVLQHNDNEKSNRKELYELLTGKNAKLLSDNFMLLSFDNLSDGRAAIIDYHPLTVDYLKNLSDYAEEVGYSTSYVLRLMQHKSDDYKKITSLDHKLLFEAVTEGREIPHKIIKGHFKMLANPKSTVLKNNEDEYLVWSKNLKIFEKIYLYKREGIPKMLDKNYTNRSYLFGRALAVYHHVESRSKKEFKNKNNTIAYKFFSTMQKAPSRTLLIVKNRTIPYFKKDDYGKYFEDIVLEITDNLSQDDFNSKKPLDENFLLGYNHQLKELRTYKKSIDKNKNQ